MRVVIAPDAFKECLSAKAVADALSNGWRRARAQDDLRCVPMADGGEGTVDALVAATGGQYIEHTVTGPLGTPVTARYGVLVGGMIAVIEMAAASGLALVPPESRDAARATTRGAGELIAHVLDRGCRRIIVGIGGSATNDAGAGMAQALGIRLLDAEGRELPPGGLALRGLARIVTEGRHPGLAACEVLVACDVENPLCGPNGASLFYGPQKGADLATARALDDALRHFADVVGEQLGVDVADVPGAGAAGGLGAGLFAFTGARLRPGVVLVAEACGLEAHIAGADLVITGEGRMDRQSVFGKTPIGVAHMARKHGVPVVAVAGALEPGFECVYDHGITAALSIVRGPMPLSDAIAGSETALADTAESLARIWGVLARARGGPA